MSQGEAGSEQSPTEPPRPTRTSTPAEFTAALRALRAWSGLTYRQLEGRATARRGTLPASTIATTLGRATLPRERFVEAFTRACGLDDDDVGQWLAARRRIATNESTPSGTDRDAPVPPRSPRWRRAASLVVAVVIGAGGASGVDALLETPTSPAALAAMPVTGLRITAVGSWARIHPARLPELCVTEGRDRTGRYKTAVAAQRPCTDPVLTRVFIEPVDEDVVQFQWHHPRYGIGCLTVLLDGPGRDLIEPRDDCSEADPAQKFRLEPFGPPAIAHFRIRPIGTGQCLSLRDQSTENGAEIVQGRCSTAPDQEFLIELTEPP